MEQVSRLERQLLGARERLAVLEVRGNGPSSRFPWVTVLLVATGSFLLAAYVLGAGR